MTPPTKPTIETIAGLYQAAHSQMTTGATAVQRIVTDAARHGISEYQIREFLANDQFSEPTKT